MEIGQRLKLSGVKSRLCGIQDFGFEGFIVDTKLEGYASGVEVIRESRVCSAADGLGHHPYGFC